MFKIKSLKQLGLGVLLALIAFLFSFLISQWIHSPFKTDGVKIYYADNISSAHQILIDKFNDLNRNKIEVVPVNLPFSKFSTNERKELLTRALRSQSDRLDIFAVDVIWVPRFAKWCQPLNQFFPDINNKTLIPNVLNTAIYNSSLMAMPFYTDLMHVYYRRDLLEKLPGYEKFIEKLNAGVSWIELIDFATKSRAKHPSFFVYPGKNFEGLMCLFYTNLYSQIGNNDAGNISLGQSMEAQRSIQVLYDLVYKHKISPPEVALMDEYEGYLFALENNSVIFVGWPGLLEQHKDNLREKGLLDKIALAPLPRFASGQTVSIYGGWNLMISKNSKNKEAAAEFIRFAISEQNQRKLHEVGGYLPVHHNIFNDSAFVADNINLRFYKNLINSGMSRPLHENYTQISDIYSHFINRVIKNELSPKEALKRAEKELQGLRILADLEIE